MKAMLPLNVPLFLRLRQHERNQYRMHEFSYNYGHKCQNTVVNVDEGNVSS